MNPPKQVSILGFPFEIRKAPEGSLEDSVGICHRDEGRIEYTAGQRPITETDTVLHEVLHAILHCQGREDGGKTEETYVRALATGLVGVLKDNPEFGQWLLSNINRTK
jgi:hypothetical protein